MKIKTITAVLFFAFLFICAANIPVEARSRTNVNLNFGSVVAPPCAPVVYQGYAVESYRPYYSSAVAAPYYARPYPVAYYQVPQPYYYRPAPVVVYPQPAAYSGFGFSWSSRR